MLVNSVISVAYYFARAATDDLQGARGRCALCGCPILVTAVVAVAMVAIVVVFILPSPFARLADLSTLVGVGSLRLVDGRTLSCAIEPSVRRWSHEGVM